MPGEGIQSGGSTVDLMFDQYLKQTFFLVIIASGLPLMASAVIGLLVSIVQAATQIQEQSIGYLLRLLAVSLVIVLCGDWVASQLVTFFQETMATIPLLGQL